MWACVTIAECVITIETRKRFLSELRAGGGKLRCLLPEVTGHDQAIEVPEGLVENTDHLMNSFLNGEGPGWMLP